MVYIMRIIKVPQHKTEEAWAAYQDEVGQWDKQLVESVGGRLIGFWHTEYGQLGEISIMVAYPNLDVREKVLEKFKHPENERLEGKIAKWNDFSADQIVKVMRPLPGSSLD